jgi:hypothetical protein
MARTVTLDDGRRIALAQPEAIGEEPCPGEAHTNAWIDNCGLCAPRWGVVTKYAPIDVVAACRAGKAVMVADTREWSTGATPSQEIRMVGATEKRRGCTSHFYVFVRT